METIRNIGQKYPVKNMFNNTVDKDVQSMLLPLNLMIIFCPKYRIKNNVITPNGFISNLVSMIATLVFIFSFVYRAYMTSLQKDLNTYTFFTYVTFYDAVYYSLGSTINFLIGMIRTKESVKFILTFQKVHRFLKNGSSFNNFIIWNWITVIVTVFGPVSAYACFCILIDLPYMSIYFCYLVIYFDFNVVYAIRVIQLLENKVNLWRIQVLNFHEIENTYGVIGCKEMFQAYVDVLECYEIQKVCFQQFILYYILEIFTHALMYIQVTIEAFKLGGEINNENLPTFGTLSVIFWMVKDLTYQTILSKQCEKLYLAIQSVQDSCTLILMKNSSADQNKLCKNVLRLHRASFSMIRVCGLFYVGAALQLTLMSLLTNYTIVLLQFAYL